MILGITGYARAGKTSIANILIERVGYKLMAFADGVRALALAIDPFVQVDGDRHYTEGNTPFARYSTVLKAIGYEAAKSHPDVRQLLQRVGTEGGRGVLGERVWVEAFRNRVEHAYLDDEFALTLSDMNIVVPDVRFTNEADALREMGGFIIRVERPGIESQGGHVSETESDRIVADATIVASNLDELREQTLQVYAILEQEWQSRHAHLIPVVHVGDDVVEVETGRVIATKLGTVDSEVVQTAEHANTVAGAIDQMLEDALVADAVGGEHDVVEQAITEHITGDVVD